MKELADHLEFFAEQGVTHLRIPEPGGDTRADSRQEASSGEHREDPPAKPAASAQGQGGSAAAPWEKAAADPGFLATGDRGEEAPQPDLFASQQERTKPGIAQETQSTGGAPSKSAPSSPDGKGTSGSSDASLLEEKGEPAGAPAKQTPQPGADQRSGEPASQSVDSGGGPQAPESEKTVSETPILNSVPELPPEPIEMEEIRFILGDCTRCPLSETRTQIVFGVGNPAADLLFVGEAPGGDEDELGLPFVGAAGKLLSRIIRAIGLYRDQVYVANILKCRPPNNRDPLPEEVEQCGPFLYKQIQAVEPLVIVALGRYAAQTLLQTETPISSLRGRFHDFHGIPLMPTFHPSYLLRNSSGKRPVWEDMQAVRDKLQEMGSTYYAERE